MESIAIETIVDANVPKFKPPDSVDLVSKSPKVAPNGRVKINATQKSNI